MSIPWEFEQLSRDLIKAALGIDFESFKSGKDQGADIRYSSDKTNQIVGQCKHYASSTFSNLKSDLKNKEYPKIVKLAPERYLLITSIGMTPPNKKEVAEILGDYPQSYSDIITKETLNAWLRDNPNIERSHINLWVSSTAVLDRVLHSGIFNYTSAQKNQLEEKLKFYVNSPSFELTQDSHSCSIEEKANSTCSNRLFRS